MIIVKKDTLYVDSEHGQHPRLDEAIEHELKFQLRSFFRQDDHGRGISITFVDALVKKRKEVADALDFMNRLENQIRAELGEPAHGE